MLKELPRLAVTTFVGPRLELFVTPVTNLWLAAWWCESRLHVERKIPAQYQYYPTEQRPTTYVLARSIMTNIIVSRFGAVVFVLAAKVLCIIFPLPPFEHPINLFVSAQNSGGWPLQS